MPDVLRWSAAVAGRIVLSARGSSFADAYAVADLVRSRPDAANQVVTVTALTTAGKVVTVHKARQVAA